MAAFGCCRGHNMATWKPAYNVRYFLHILYKAKRKV